MVVYTARYGDIGYSVKLTAKALFNVVHHAQHYHNYGANHSQRHRLKYRPDPLRRNSCAAPPMTAEPVNSASQCLLSPFHRGWTDITDLPVKLSPRPKWLNSFVTERPCIIDPVTLHPFKHDSSSVGASTTPVKSPSIVTHEILELVQSTKRL